MAEAVSTDQKNEFLMEEAAPAPNGMRAVEDGSPILSDRAPGIPLPRDAVSLSVSCIPIDRNAELLREMGEAAAANNAEQARDIIVRWAMIGSFYADSDRKVTTPTRQIGGLLR